MEELLRFASWLLLAGAVLWQTLSVHDWSAVTTDELLQKWKTLNGQELILSNVSIQKYDIQTDGDDTFVMLRLANGRTNPPKDQPAVEVAGRMSTADADRFGSLTWYLKNGTTGLLQTRVVIRDKLAILKTYVDPSDESWFSTPYFLGLSITNHWLSLQASVYAGIVIQTLVFGVIALLIHQGLVHLFPRIG